MTKEIYNQNGERVAYIDARGRITHYAYEDGLTITTGKYQYQIKQQANIKLVYQIIDGVKTLLRLDSFDSQDQLQFSLVVGQSSDVINRVIENKATLQALLSSFPDNVCEQIAQLTGVEYAIAYHYSSGIVDQIKQSDQTGIQFTIDPKTFILQSVKLGDTYGADIYYDIPASGQTTLVDSEGIPLRVQVNNQKQITTLFRACGELSSSTQFLQTHYQYYANKQLKQITHSDQSVSAFAYEHPFGLLTQKALPDNRITDFYYGKSPISVSNRLASTTLPAFSDINSVITRAQYLASRDPLSKDHRLLATRYVYDYAFGPDKAYRFLRFVIHPSGQVQELTPDGRQGLLGELRFDRKYLSARYNTDKLPMDQAILLSQMHTWVAGLADKQQLSDVDLLEYDHTSQGLIQDLYHYAQVDQQGNGEKNAETGHIHHDYTQHGNWKEKQDWQKQKTVAKTTRKHDGLERLIQQTQADGGITHHTFNDTANQQVTTFANQRVRLTQRNSQGFVDSLTEVGSTQNELAESVVQTRKTVITRDKDQRPRVITHPDQNKTYLFYNQQQQPALAVSTTGIIIRHQYHKAQRYIQKTRYAKRIPIEVMYGSNPPYGKKLPKAVLTYDWIKNNADPEKDITSYTFYNSNQLPIFEVDAAGHYVQKRYDSLNRLIGVYYFIEKISDDLLQKLLKGETITTLPSVIEAACYQFFYLDDTKHLIGHQDSDGYVVRYQYDIGKRCHQKTVYHDPTKVDLTADFQQLLATVIPNEEKDGETYYFHNQRGLCIAEISPTGQLIEHLYFKGGLRKQSIMYGDPVPEEHRHVKAPVSQLAKQLSNDKDQLIFYDYDLVNRLTKYVHQYNATNLSNAEQRTRSYDFMGDQLSDQYQDLLQPNNPSGDTKRDKFWQYDQWQQQTQYTNPYVAQPDSNRFGFPAKHIYDATGLLVITSNPHTSYTFHYYDAERRPIVEISWAKGLNSRVTEYTYGDDSLKPITKRVYKAYFPAQDYQLTGGFLPASLRDTLDKLKNDQEDAISHYTYTKRELIESITNPDGSITKRAYNYRKQLAQEDKPIIGKNPTLTITHKHNLRGLETFTERRAGELSSLIQREYANPYGYETRLINALTGEYQKAYDQAGNLQQVINPVGDIIHTLTHDVFSRVKTDTNAVGVEMGYDYPPRKIIQTNRQSGSQLTREQNIFEQTIRQSNRLSLTQSATSQFMHNPVGHVREQVDPVGDITRSEYSTTGWPRQHTTPLDKRTSFLHDQVGVERGTMVYAGNQKKYQTDKLLNALGQADNETNPNHFKTINDFSPGGKLRTAHFDPSTEFYRGLNLLTTQTFTGQGKVWTRNQGNIATPNLYQENFDYDGFGRQSKHCIAPDTLNITRETKYNPADKIIAKIDPNGQVTRFFYDKSGNLCLKVTPLGQVTRWYWKKNHRLTFKRDYSSAIDASDLNDKTTLEEALKYLKDRDTDLFINYYYNADNDLCFIINSNGDVIETKYDLNHHAQQSIQYSTKMTSKVYHQEWSYQELLVWAKNNTSTTDSHEYFLLDDKGQRRFILSQNGHLVEQQFNAESKRTARIAYAVKIPNVQSFSKKTLAEVEEFLVDKRQVNNDKREFWLYDDLSHLQYHVNPENEVKRFYANNMGDRLREVQFSQKITPFYDAKSIEAAVDKLDPNLLSNHNIIQLYNAANQRVVVSRLQGRNTYTFYNGLSKKGVTVDAEGRVTLNSYDAAKRLVQQYRYVHTIDMTKVNEDKTMKEILALCTFDPEHDQHQWYFRDKKGNIRFTINAKNGPNQLGEVTQYQYDGDNRLIETTVYQTPHTTKQIDGLKLTQLDDWVSKNHSPSDAITLRVYDAFSNMRFTVKANGEVIQSQYDLVGHEILRFTYAPVLDDPQALLGLSVDQVLSYLDEQHIEISTTLAKFYDGQGRLLYSANTLGEVSSFTHDANSNLQQVMTFAENVEMTDNYQELLQRVSTLVDSNRKKGNNEYTKWDYNFANLPIAKTTTLGFVSRIFYDTSGRQRFAIQADGRIQSWSYNQFGKLSLTRYYVNKINPMQITLSTTLIELIDLLKKEQLANDADDRMEWRYYNSANQLVFQVDNTQRVQQYQYDLSGMPSSHIVYSTKAPKTEYQQWDYAKALAWSKTATNTDDVVSYDIYDGLQHKRFTLDPMGYLTQFNYDLSGNRISHIRYQLSPSCIFRSKPPIDSILFRPLILF